jgi:phage terminase large subunit
LSDRENADWLKAKGYANDHTYIIADSSEPKTIDLYRNDYNVTNILAATKGPGSVETGEKWLNDEILEIVIDERRTPNIGREFRTIDYARTKDGTILSRLDDKMNHAIDATRYAFEDDIGVGTYEDYGFMSGGGLI